MKILKVIWRSVRIVAELVPLICVLVMVGCMVGMIVYNIWVHPVFNVLIVLGSLTAMMAFVIIDEKVKRSGRIQRFIKELNS